MPHARITSLRNPQLKRFLKLRDHKERQASGLTIVEGLREVLRAHQAGVDFKQLFLCRDLLRNYDQESWIDQAGSKKTELFEVPKGIFAKISFGERHEGILAVVRPRFLRLEDIRFQKNPLCCVVEGLEKPGNLGAILRTCDAVGADCLLVCDGKTDIYNPNVIRASLGAVFCVKVVQTTQESALKFLKDRKVKVCVTTPHATALYTQANLNESLAVILGSEQKGLSDFWLQQADMKVKIPMKGLGDSLNVSTTAAIVMYEALRQRGAYGV